MQVRYEMPLLAVRDVKLSVRFYEQLLDQHVVMDFGKNVTMSGGFALQQDFDRLTGVPSCTILRQSNNMELYFEVDEFDAFLARLNQYGEVDFVHGPIKHDWQQRVVRLYDPDWHMIEVGESMARIVCRLLDEGKTPEQVAALTQHPLSFVLACEKGSE